MDFSKERVRYISMVTGLLACALLLAAHLAYVYLADASRFPISTVKIMAPYIHLSHQEIERVVGKYSNASFFSVSVKDLSNELQSINWVEDSTVERVWPNTLKIKIEEKTPFAVYNSSLITKDGFIFADNKKNYAIDVPILQGPENQQKEVLQVFEKLSKILTNYGLNASKLELRKNGAWQLTLTNGVLLRLGKQDLDVRIAQFCKAYPAVFAGNDDKATQLFSADLRYPHGMAVQWKNKREDNG